LWELGGGGQCTDFCGFPLFGGQNGQWVTRVDIILRKRLFFDPIYQKTLSEIIKFQNFFFWGGALCDIRYSYPTQNFGGPPPPLPTIYAASHTIHPQVQLSATRVHANFNDNLFGSGDFGLNQFGWHVCMYNVLLLFSKNIKQINKLTSTFLVSE